MGGLFILVFLLWSIFKIINGVFLFLYYFISFDLIFGLRRGLCLISQEKNALLPSSAFLNVGTCSFGS